DGFCLTMSISGDFQRHTIRRSRKLVGLMRSREEYFVLRRSAAYAGQSPFAAPVGPAIIAPSCATREQHQIRSTRQIDARREGKVMEVTFCRARHRWLAKTRLPRPIDAPSAELVKLGISFQVAP